MMQTKVFDSRHIEKMIKGFEAKATDRISRNSVSAGLTQLRKAIKKAAPVGPTGNIKASIGSRISNAYPGKPRTGKAGINVGKRPKNAKKKRRVAPHGHLVALGTGPRARKKMGGKYARIRNPQPYHLNTGTMPANDFVRRASIAAGPSVKTAMVAAVKRAMIREAEKARKKGNR